MADDELQSLIDDCRSIYVEHDFISRWARVELYHKVGERIYKSPFRNKPEVFVTVTQQTGIKQRNLYRAIQFYEKFPDLNSLPEGKNVSWHKICNEYLPEPADKTEPEMCVCPDCGREHKRKAKE